MRFLYYFPMDNKVHLQYSFTEKNSKKLTVSIDVYADHVIRRKSKGRNEVSLTYIASKLLSDSCLLLDFLDTAITNNNIKPQDIRVPCYFKTRW